MTPIHGIGLEPVVAVETVRDLIKGAPTITAIPVEWLEDRVYDMKRAPLYRRYAEMLLMEWLQEQKEQEAQDG
jgi:hypothetical protein